MPLLLSESWESLRAKFGQDRWKSDLTLLGQSARLRLREDITPDWVPELGAPEPADNVRSLLLAVQDSAFLHRVTDDPLDIPNSVRIIENILGRKHWMHPGAKAAYEIAKEDNIRGTTADLYTATFTRDMAAILDWIGDELPSPLVADMKEQIRRRGTDDIYDNIKRGVYWSTWYISNWCTCMMIGLAAGSAHDIASDPMADAKIEDAALRTRRFLDAQGSDGGYHEGVTYSITLQDPIQMSIILESLGKPTLLDHPYLQTFGDFVLHSIFPGFTGWANFSDAGLSLSTLPHLAFLAKRLNRPDWQWAVRNIYERLPEKGLTDLLWYDPDLPTEKPTIEKRARLFTNTHFAFVRDSWEDDARCVMVPAGSASFGHRHADLGSFMLNEFGERQIADSGIHLYGWYCDGDLKAKSDPWHYTCQAHSTLLVNGEGYYWVDGYRTRLTAITPEDFGPAYALIEDFQVSDNADIVTVDATKPYHETLDRFVRTVVSIHDGPVLVLDDILTKPEKAGAELEIRFIATEQARCSANTFTISHEKSECLGLALVPSSAVVLLDEQQEEINIGTVLIPIRIVQKLAGDVRAARFVTLLSPYLRGNMPKYEVATQENGDALSLQISSGQATWSVTWDGNTAQVQRDLIV